MGTKVTSSSGSVLEEPDIQKLQMQAKIFKENSLNKLNALKSTTQLLDRQSIWYQQAFARLFGDSFRTFKFQLSQHMNNLETLLNAETLHEMDSKSALNWYQRHGYREQGQNLNYNHISFSAIKVLRATTFRNKTMSSPNRSTSDIEDAFSSMNILNYTSVSSDYFPASSGSSSFNSSENSTDNMIPPVFSSFYNNPCLKDVQAFYAKESPISSPDPITSPAILTPSPVLPPSLLFDPRYFFVPEELLPPKKRICSSSSSSTTLSNSSRNQTCNLVSPSFSVSTSTPPQVFEIGKCSDKMYLKHHEKQVEDILNYLDELHLHRIERMEEERTNGNELKTELKRIRTQIIRLQKKRLGQKDKIAFAYYRISNLEQIIEKIQARHQTDQEDL
ncbi:hypothetical protein Tco_0628447 [Tanacetum coccineum]|uniref:Uncharacterized protein n=1 Tax=Tanacetum coccineum TaxID=301880 RepID=A0ABQ4WQB8_9ASTR